MNEQISIFDLMDDDERERFAPQKSNDWKWQFSDYPKEKNGIKVFSCFACGGGSTMGYKLAGCEVLGCVEIDPKMNEIYLTNHHPKYNFCMDLRDFNNLPDSDIPDELFNIDVLDGSPPCTTFSMAGERENSWGKKKKFREGQKEQTLDDLSFVFIDTVRKLKPKVVIMENVEGLILGEAWSYVQRIYKEFNAAGYSVFHWLLKGEYMGIPQTRHRVFFVACRKDLNIKPESLDMQFNYEPVTYGEIKEGKTFPLEKNSIYYQIAIKAIDSDKSIADTRIRYGEKGAAFQTLYIRDGNVVPTVRSTTADLIDLSEMAYVSRETVRNSQTFPRDYNFGAETRARTSYVCGMSVPPVMMKRVVQRLIDQGVFDYKNDSDLQRTRR